MSRGIDHLVLAVRDLDMAATEYERLGFTLTPRAQHPFGTGNRLAQFDHDFLELLSVTRPEDISDHQDGAISFGAFNRDYLNAREGMSMIALKSNSWEEDRKTFADAGLSLSAPFEFSRLARQPDGSDVTVGFKLTFVPDPTTPEAIFFTCDHQHAPEYFYKPAFQKHENGAVAIDEVMMVANDPSKSEGYFSRLYGAENVQNLDGQLIVQGKGSRFVIMTPGDFSTLYPGSDPITFTGDMVFAGYRVLVDDLATTRFVLEKNGVKFTGQSGSLWLPAFGTILEFSAQSKGRTRNE